MKVRPRISIPTKDSDILSHLLIAVAVALTALLATLAIVWAWVSVRYSARGHMPEKVAQAERLELLNAIKRAATEPQMNINITRFWKDRGWNSSQKHWIIKPMIDRRIIHRVASNDQLSNLLSGFNYLVLRRPPRQVILNSRDWTRMATNQISAPIIIGSIHSSSVQIGDKNQMTVAIDGIRKLSDALQSDSAHLPQPQADEAQEIAKNLKSEDTRGANLVKWIDLAQKLAAATGTMVATVEALEHLT